MHRRSEGRQIEKLDVVLIILLFITDCILYFAFKVKLLFI